MVARIRSSAARTLAAFAAVCLTLLCCLGRPDHPPDVTMIPDGESFPFVGSPAAMWSEAVDMDGDSAAIRFSWGDGDTSGWSSWSHYSLALDYRISMTHVWNSAGAFTVTAQAKDKRGAASDWSSGYTVHVITGWARTYGGREDDEGRSVRQTRDGGYIIAGLTNSSGMGCTAVWLIKTNASGDTSWTRPFCGRSWGNSVCQTADGGYVVTGGMRDTSPGEILLLKTDQDGDSVWARTYNTLTDDGGMSVEQTKDGGYIVLGSTAARGAGLYDVWLLRTDANGDTLWTRTYGGPGMDEGKSIQQTQDGGYIVLANTTSFGTGSNDIWLIKIDAKGDSIWARTYGGSGGEYGNSVCQTRDGGYVITGQDQYGNPDSWGLLLIETDADGDEVWARSFSGGIDAEGRSVCQTLDGGYIVAGCRDVHAADLWLIRTDANGDTLWTRTFGWEGNDIGNCVQQTSDGGFIVVGTTDSYGAGMEDVWLIRLDPDGAITGLP